MLVECLAQCDVTIEGPEHPASRKRVLFPGIRYDYPESVLSGALLTGKVRTIGDSPALARAVSRPRGKV